ncbi:MAG: DNA replication protein DnaC [Verrucomicrobia bacterium ADurb.Bin118]|jgi:DNA replication protein DnaC|nr:MAG: DNA replication protein DnaC [Verrucomicrobia bacterium ADurb.Bin118]
MSEPTLAECQRRLEQRRREVKITVSGASGNVVKAGDVRVSCFGGPLRDGPGVCEPSEADIEARQQARQVVISGALAASNVPLRHANREPLDRSGPWNVAYERILGKLGTGFTIVLAGLRGNGKTQLGVELIRQFILTERRGSALFSTATQFFMAIKAGYDGQGKPEAKVLAQYRRPRLLVIDELAQRRESEWERLLLYELLNHRYNDLTDTLLISNQDVRQAELSLGPAIVSRLRETGGIIQADWASYREKV